jgi:hypothetical protein
MVAVHKKVVAASIAAAQKRAERDRRATAEHFMRSRFLPAMTATHSRAVRSNIASAFIGKSFVENGINSRRPPTGHNVWAAWPWSLPRSRCHRTTRARRTDWIRRFNKA